MVLVRSWRMGSRLAVATGLLAGLLVGGLAVGGAVALLPPPPAPTIPAPSPIVVATPQASSSPSAAPEPVASPSASPTPSPTPTAQAFGIGQLAPDLKLARAGGGTLNLLSLRGKPVWVNFMATWCPECRTELPQMAGFQARYARAGLTVVLIDVREPGADVTGYLKSIGVSLPVGIDADGAAAAAWRTLALPTHFWLTGEGVIAAGAVGSIGPDQMAANLQTILPGVTVTP